MNATKTLAKREKELKDQGEEMALRFMLSFQPIGKTEERQYRLANSILSDFWALGEFEVDFGIAYQIVQLFPALMLRVKESGESQNLKTLHDLGFFGKVSCKKE